MQGLDLIMQSTQTLHGKDSQSQRDRPTSTSPRSTQAIRGYPGKDRSSILIRSDTDAVFALGLQTDARKKASSCIVKHRRVRTSGYLLCFGRLLRTCAIVSGKPESRKEEEADASADRADVVWPRSAEEARVPVVSWRDKRDDSRAMEVRQTE